jgi:hypothetical protein
MSPVIDYRKWRWGYFEPAFFKIVGDRVVNVASGVGLVGEKFINTCFSVFHGC